MKKIIVSLLMVLLFWIVELKDGTVYKGVDLAPGNNGITLIMADKTTIMFPWYQIRAIYEKK